MYAERLPPHDIDAEESVIGSILIDGESLTRVTSFLEPRDIYNEKNRWCYEACLALFQRSEAVNQVSVAHELSLQGRLETVGGASYLSHLVLVVPTSVHIEHYARIVQRTSLMRQIIRAGGDIAAIGYEGAADADTALTHAEDRLFQIRSGRRAGDFAHIREILDIYMEESAAIHGPDARHVAPVATGFADLDRLLGGGLQRSDMVVLAARPSLGKSTLALNMARYAASQGDIVGVFSLEMGADQIGVRLLSSEAAVDSHRLRLGLLNDADERRLLDAIGLLSDLPIFIDDTPVQGIVEMRGKARRLQAERGLDLLIVDYLQLLDPPRGRRPDNREQEVSAISRMMKAHAKDLGIPIVALAQLNRKVEDRVGKRPQLSDLRDSGSLEQDSDVVILLHRPSYYGITKVKRENGISEDVTHLAEAIVAKQRNGPTGTVQLYFDERCGLFGNWERQS